MRVLQAIWDGGGNTPQQLAIARALIKRGHEVNVLGHRCQRERAEASGAAFAAYNHAPDADSSKPETDLLRDWEARTPIGAFARVRDRLMYGPSRLFARDLLETLERWPADVVAWDYLLIGAGIGAERAGVASAAVIHTIYPLPADGVPPFGPGLMPARGVLGRIRDAALRRVLERSFSPGLSAANQAREELGLEPLNTPFDQISRSDRVLVLTAPEFDFAGSAALPDNVRYVGPVIEGGPAAGADTPGQSADERPLVLASFSTTFMDQQGLADRTVRALGELPVRGLLTTGPAIDRGSLPQRDNVEIREFARHSEVLPEAGLVITHAGMGTVHAALSAGVPLVCMPHGRDQDDVAARVAFHGAGVRTARKASVRKLRRVISRALADPSLKDGAQRMAKAINDHDGADRAVAELESLAG